MIEAIGDLWTYPAEYRVVTTNCILKSNGELVMGAGVARQAAERFPDLPRYLGDWVFHMGDDPAFVDSCRIITFPTKYHWKDRADLRLIAWSAEWLRKGVDYWDIKSVAMTRPGCGLGGLKWADVKPILEPWLDDRFTVLTPR